MAASMPPQVSIRVFREHLGLSLEQVAERVRGQGVPITADGLNNAELGHKPVSQTVLAAWAKALNVDVWNVRTGKDLVQWVNAVQGDAGCTCGAGLPRNRRPAKAAA